MHIFGSVSGQCGIDGIGSSGIDSTAWKCSSEAENALTSIIIIITFLN